MYGNDHCLLRPTTSTQLLRVKKDQYYSTLYWCVKVPSIRVKRFNELVLTPSWIWVIWLLTGHLQGLSWYPHQKANEITSRPHKVCVLCNKYWRFLIPVLIIFYFQQLKQMLFQTDYSKLTDSRIKGKIKNQVKLTQGKSTN